MDDDFLNLVLTNNGNGPSATQFANGLGQGGAGAGSPPLSSLFETGLGGDVIASMLPQLGDTGAPSASLSPSLASAPTGNAPLSSLFSIGLGGGVIASMLPQRQDTSAALLSRSALQSPSALYDPNPPAPTMDQMAVMLGVPPEAVAAIGDQATRQAMFDVGSKAVLGPATEMILPEIGVPEEVARTAATIMDIANHISEPSDEQYIQNAPDKAVFNYLSGTEFQIIPSAAKAWIP